MDRARADDHLAGGEVRAVGEPHADRAAAGERDPVDQCAAPYHEIRARARRVEVRIVGRHALPVAQR